MARMAVMERVHIVSLKGLSRRQASIVREGQREAAHVWNTCWDLHFEARQAHTPWPGRDAYHQATRGGRGMRSLKRLHRKQLGGIQKLRSRCQKGSRRWRKLEKTRARLTRCAASPAV